MLDRGKVSSIPRPTPKSAPPPAPVRFPPDTTIRSLECWSIQGHAGDKTSDAFVARAALAYGCRYGLNRFGRLVFVFLPVRDAEGRVVDQHGRAEYEVQSRSWAVRRPTLVNGGVTETLRKISRG